MLVFAEGAWMWRAWSENCAKNPENLRGQDFAKSEDMRGQTRSFGAQTVSSHVFNAKSCPLRFSRNLCKALRPGTPHPRTSQAEGKAKIWQTYTLHPAGYLFFNVPFTSFPNPRGYPSTQSKCHPLEWAASSGSIVRDSPFRYRSSLGSVSYTHLWTVPLCQFPYPLTRTEASGKILL